MSNPGMSDPKATRLARMALALYPPSWRARYGDEVHALSTGLVAWSFLIGLGLVFAQLTQFQGLHPAGHPIIKASYLVFDAALALSMAAAGLGGLPLWLLMLRRAHREHRRGDKREQQVGHVAAAAILVATAAIIVAVTGLCLWARGFAGYHHAAIPGVYLALVVVAAAVTAVSAARGTRAALADSARNVLV
jgi:hypothetical protein